MAEKKINKSLLSPDEHKLRNTSIELIERGLPIIEDHLNKYIVNGKNNYIQVFKPETGTYRPYLVVWVEALHTSLVVYKTSRLKNERIDIDNKIRGEHLLKTPKALANYISKSAITGGVKDNGISVIDKDRFFFVTEDAFLKVGHRAKDINDFKIGLHVHANNLNKIDELLKKDLADENFLSVIKSGEPHLWTFAATEGRAIIINPTAQYLSMFLNMSASFKNENFDLNQDQLQELGELSGAVLETYADYINHTNKIIEMEEQDKRLFDAFESVRYFHNIVTDYNLKKMEEVSNKRGENRYLYGDPIVYEKVSLDNRISLELVRWGILKGSKEFKQYASIIKSMLEDEKKLTKKLSTSANEVIAYLNKVNKSYRFDLMEFPYQQSLWKNLHASTSNQDYVLGLKEDFRQKYIHLSNVYMQEKVNRREKIRSKKEQSKKTQKEVDEIAKILLKKKQDLKKSLERNFLLYSKAFNQYIEGKLPLKEEDKAKFEKLVNAWHNPNLSGELGKEIGEKISKNLSVMNTMVPSLEETFNMAKTSTEKMEELKSNADAEMMIDMLTKISNEIKKASKKGESRTKKEQEKLIRSVVSGVVDDLSEEDLEFILDPDFSFGKNTEEVLMCMQDVYNSKSMLNAFSSLRERKMSIILALNQLNEPQLINDFNQAKIAVSELSKSGVIIPVAGGNKGYDDILEELRKIGEGKSINKMDIKQHQELEEYILLQVQTMKKFIEFSGKLLVSRDEFYETLKNYQNEIENHHEVCMRSIEEMRSQISTGLERNLKDPEKQGFIKKDGVWFDAQANEKISKKELNKRMDFFLGVQASCFNPASYSDVKMGQEAISLLHKNVFPPAQEVVKETKKRVGQSSTIEDAIKVYNEATQNLINIGGEKEKFSELLEDGYPIAIQSFAKILIDLNYWKQGLRNLKDDIRNHYSEDQLVYMGPAIDLACEQYEKRVDNELVEFRTAIVERVKQISKNLPSRAVQPIALDAFLNKSVVKSLGFKNTVMLPQSVVGDKGVCDTIVAYALEKHKASEIFAAMMEEDETNVSQYKKLSVDKVGHTIIRNLNEFITIELKRVQKEQVKQIELDFAESIRCFALQDDAKRNFVMNDDQFLAFMKLMAKNKCRPVKRVSFSIDDCSDAQDRVNCVDFIRLVREALPSIRKAIAEGTRIEGGKTEMEYLDSLQSIYDQYFSMLGGSSSSSFM